MTVNAVESRQKVVKLVQELLLEEDDRSAITPDFISKKIDLIVALNPKWGDGLDRDAVTDELIRRFSLWIGQDTLLKNDTGHVSWLNAARKKDWRYWQRYQEWLERSLSSRAVEGMDKSSDTSLGLLEDPTRTGNWDRRGLVVGHVQSGKTANYTGLICKAADAGYKIIIVLAGLHNNLRSQTQMRLDEGFLGYETRPGLDDLQIIGVGEIDGDPAIRPNFATNRSDKGDFSTAVARNLGITPEQRPWLFVVKKNKTVLERLYRWIANHVADAKEPGTGRKVVTQLPLLLIDDEADHASVDTGEQLFDAEGNPDEEHNPTAINSRIRKILHTFARAAYVGYTATPFANIFIHERGATREEGPDLFPSAFIINLAASSEYIGPARVFGLQGVDGREGGLPLIREIDDFDPLDDGTGWMPQNHKNYHHPLFNVKSLLPDSLVEAIDAFLLSCVVRHLRGQGDQHCSMLVHVTRYNAVQNEVSQQIENHLRSMRQRLSRHIDHENIISRLQHLWETDFIATHRAVEIHSPAFAGEISWSWEQIEAELLLLLQDIEVRMINGKAKDALDYAENKGKGLKVIAIGGDKLARGLTLEGLSVSYFLRASKMYDTLMQMGRWFGYRPGYLDLCRLYTTDELVEWFQHIADAAEELREEFELMAASGDTPKSYGLKVQSHPVLMVTSRLKMRSAKDLMLSFSGELLETVALYRRPETLRHNFDAAASLVLSMGAPDEIDPVRTRSSGVIQKWTGYLWNQVPSANIIDFFLAYRTHSEAYKVKSELLVDFIQSMNDGHELTIWTVALIGGGEGGKCHFPGSIAVDMLKRSNKGEHENKYSIGRLLSPRDESIDLEEHAWQEALAVTHAAFKPDPAKGSDGKPQEPPSLPSGPAIRKVKGFGGQGIAPARERGLLLLSVLDPELAGGGLFPTGSPPVIAFGVSFPGSNSGRKVLYKVNSVQWQQWGREYGPAD